MDSPAPPMEIDREDLWLLGLIGILLLGAGVSFAWSSVQTDVAEFYVGRTVDGEPVDVTIERWSGTGFTPVHQQAGSTWNEPMYRTTEPGRYRVVLATNSTSCELRTNIYETENGLAQHTLGEKPECPGWLTVRITDEEVWDAPS